MDHTLTSYTEENTGHIKNHECKKYLYAHSEMYIKDRFKPLAPRIKI